MNLMIELSFLLFGFVAISMCFNLKYSPQNKFRSTPINTQIYDSVPIGHVHPVVYIVLQRWKEGSLPGERHMLDKNKVALCIEGGGMRGCIAAGASAALHFLGLSNAVDIVYGSSAGSMVGAYFVSRQLAGTQIYSGRVQTHLTKLSSIVSFIRLFT